MKSSCNVLGVGSKAASNITEWKPASIVVETTEDNQNPQNGEGEINLAVDTVITIEKEMRVASILSTPFRLNDHISRKKSAQKY